jgi:hypothetical protein
MLMKNNIALRFILILTIAFIWTNKPFSQVLKHSKLSYIQTDQNILGKSIRYKDDKVYFTAINDSLNYKHTVLFYYDTKQSKIIWSKKISLKDNYVYPVNIQITKDGEILLGAYDFALNQGLSGTNMLFLLFDADGNLKWKKHLGGLDNEQLRDFIIDSENNICFTADYYGQSQYLCVFGKLDKDFNLITHNSVKKTLYNYPYSIAQLNDGKYLVSGSTSIPNEPHRGFIALTDKDMNIIKSVELNTPGLQNSINKLYVGTDNTIYAFCEYSAIAYCFKFNDTLKLLDQFEISYGDINSVFEINKEIIVLNFKANWLGKLMDKSYQTLGYYPVNGLLWSVDYDEDKNMVYGVGYTNINDSQKSFMPFSEHTFGYTSECALNPYNTTGGKESNLEFRAFEFNKNPITLITKPADEIVVEIENKYFVNLECQSFANSTDETIAGKFEIFPNPAFDRINFQNPNKNGIEIIDIYGRLIGRIKAEENGTDISFLKSGFYLLRSGNQTAKMIKM